MKKIGRKDIFRSYSLKFNLAMKLTVLLLVVSIFSVNANGYGQKTKVTIDLYHVEMREVLETIETLTDFKFLYNNKKIDAEKMVSIRAKNKPVSEVLDELFEGTTIYYVLRKKQIILKTKSSSLHSTLLKESPLNKNEEIVQRTVSGTVTDGQGVPLSGANIVEKGTTNGVTADFDGNFSLNVSDENATLVVSYIGFATKEVAVNGHQTITVVLEESAAGLDEVVLVSYGQQSLKNITGAIENVKVTELQNEPVAQVAQMLQGKVSGVRITQTTGRPGEGMKIQIRGAASITAGTDPLYVVDGMPITGDISDINPSEIENISVLKDAAASSLYGSRAANGVVLIQTRTAHPGETNIGFSTYTGFQQIPENRKLKMMDAREYAQFQKEVAEENGRPVDPLFQNPEQYGKGTNWFDEITRTGYVQSYNLSINAGTEKFSTAVTAGYFKQDGVVQETGYDRYSLRINTKFRPSDKLDIGFNLAPTFSTNSNFSSDGGPYGTENIVSSAIITTPLASPYNPDGSLALTASDPATFGNPNWLRVAKDKVYEDKDFSLLSNAYIEYEFFEGFKAKISMNVQLGHSKLFQFNPSTIGTLFSPPPHIPTGSENNNQYYNWVNENILTYEKKIGDHSFDILAGLTAQKYRNEGTNIVATNYADDKIQSVGAAGQTAVTSNVQEWTLISYLARLNYNYNDRYLLSASFRRDGSSRFGPENRWGNFPSASIGWILSNEDFWNIEPVSFLKLRASYGLTGNFNIGNYSFRSTIGPVYYTFGNSPYQARAVNNLGDQGLGWEKNKELNIGANINLFKDRIQLTYNYYIKNTNDLLFNVSVPLSSGFTQLQTNIGSLKFWGNEIALSSYNIQNDKFSWNTDFNISFDRNKVVSLDTQNGVLFQGAQNYNFWSHISQVGQPMSQFYGAVQDGVYVNQEDFDNSPKHASSAVGTIKFKDLNGDGVVTFPEDYTTIGNPWPDFIFGMTNTIRFNRFDFSVSITGSYGNDILTHYENWATNLDGVFNVLEEVKDRWKSPENPGAGLYGSTQQGTTFLERDRWSTRYIKDGSYLNFKNITLGYTLPTERMKAIKKFRIYSSIQNAYIITNYPGPNPEVNTRSSASGSTPGFDENSYPVPRTVSIGLNCEF